MEFLRNLKDKSPHVKTNVAFGSALIVTLVIALIWVTTLPAKFNGATENTAAVGEPLKAKEGNPFSDIVSGAKEKFMGLMSAFESKSEPTEDPQKEQNVETASTTPAFVIATSTATTTKPVAASTTPQRKIIQIGTSTESRTR